MNRLALGTAQFGFAYGVANRTGQVPLDVVAAILRQAAAAGINVLDTAIAYGDSEQRLGAAGVSQWRVVTKLPPLAERTSSLRTWVHEQIRGSLDRLDVDQLEAVLVHRALDLVGDRGKEYARALEALKCEGLTRAIGVSIYGPDELEELCRWWQPDLVQAPYNVLDRRLLRSGWLRELKRRGVRVHTRSVFLQGLLLMKQPERPPWFSRWSALLDRWLDWCKSQHVDPLPTALAFALAQPDIERVVIGVDSLPQLKQILQVATAWAPPIPPDLSSEDLELVEPRRWKLQ